MQIPFFEEIGGKLRTGEPTGHEAFRLQIVLPLFRVVDFLEDADVEGLHVLVGLWRRDDAALHVVDHVLAVAELLEGRNLAEPAGQLARRG